MKAKQILDAFSETLMQDDRILSPRERELLTSLLQNSRVVSGHNPEIQSAVNAAIARSVGETVAQRAFALLGGSIVEQILARAEISPAADGTIPGARLEMPAPQPPSGPQGVPKPPSTPHPHKPAEPAKAPQPPSPSGSAHGIRPVATRQDANSNPRDLGGRVGVLEAPAVVGAQCVVLEEFLAPQELEELVAFALQHEADFQNSEVISPAGDPGVLDYSHRRSRVLMDLGKWDRVILERIRCVLPRVLDQLGMSEFPVTHVEAQITASNHGDFFGVHSDDAQETIASRRLTFVYFFHREPCPFEGGELHLHDSGGTVESHGNGNSSGYQTIMPRQNQIVFFPCSVLHEITPVDCPSRAFADSRFTVNGWLHH